MERIPSPDRKLNRIRTRYRIVRIFGIILFLFAAPSLSAQHIILNYFTAQRVGDEILLRWEIKSGNTCNGIFIQRAGADGNFVEIGEIQGVCGDPSFAAAFDFIDTDPLANATNHYRLQLGVQGFTEVVELPFVDYGEDDYQILGMPVDDNSVLDFRKRSGETYTLSIFDAKGDEVASVSGIETNQVPLNQFDPPSAMYFFRLEGSEGHTISGKLVY